MPSSVRTVHFMSQHIWYWLSILSTSLLCTVWNAFLSILISLSSFATCSSVSFLRSCIVLCLHCLWYSSRVSATKLTLVLKLLSYQLILILSSDWCRMKYRYRMMISIDLNRYHQENFAANSLVLEFLWSYSMILSNLSLA